MTVSSVGGAASAPQGSGRTLIPRVADPLFQPALAAFVAPAAKARLLSPSALAVLDMIYESRLTRLNVLV